MSGLPGTDSGARVGAAAPGLPEEEDPQAVGAMDDPGVVGAEEHGMARSAPVGGDAPEVSASGARHGGAAGEEAFQREFDRFVRSVLTDGPMTFAVLGGAWHKHCEETGMRFECGKLASRLEQMFGIRVTRDASIPGGGRAELKSPRFADADTARAAASRAAEAAARPPEELPTGFAAFIRAALTKGPATFAVLGAAWHKHCEEHRIPFERGKLAVRLEQVPRVRVIRDPLSGGGGWAELVARRHAAPAESRAGRPQSTARPGGWPASFMAVFRYVLADGPLCIDRLDIEWRNHCGEAGITYEPSQVVEGLENLLGVRVVRNDARPGGGWVELSPSRVITTGSAWRTDELPDGFVTFVHAAVIDGPMDLAALGASWRDRCGETASTFEREQMQRRLGALPEMLKVRGPLARQAERAGVDYMRDSAPGPGAYYDAPDIRDGYMADFAALSGSYEYADTSY